MTLEQIAALIAERDTLRAQLDALRGQEPEKYRLMHKEGIAWIPASEWFSEPDESWIRLVREHPNEWCIKQPITGEKVADAFAKALAAPVAPAQPAPDQQLLKFYAVDSYPDLVAMMLHHIEKLQSKLPPLSGSSSDGKTDWFDKPQNGTESPAQAVNAELVDSLGKLYKKYVNLLESGRDRILELGGTCDPVDTMEMSDPGLRDASTTLANAKAAQQKEQK